MRAPAAEALRPLGDLSTNQPASTRKMAALLQTIRKSNHAEGNRFLGKEWAEIQKQQLAQTTNFDAYMRLAADLSINLLNSGENQESLNLLDRMDTLFRQNGLAPTEPTLTWMRNERALCWLRIGEMENCVANHTAASCIAPIAPAGVHQLPRGSRAALGILSEQLEKHPDDLRARWLFNIASMTVGDYPHKVPPQWLVPPSAFASDGDVGHFIDIAPNLGLDNNDLAGGVVADDFDNDGLIDLLVSSWGMDGPLRYFHNNGDGTFTERTHEAGLDGEVGALNMIQADYNNDGFVDVLLLRGGWLGKEGHYPVSLLRNNGDGTFTDVTEEAGLLRFRPTQTATWFDYNNDGWLDLFIGNESTGDDVNPCELYRNNGNGTFTEVAAQCGVAVVGFVKAVTSGDYNNDGRPDLYLSLRDAPNILFRNDGKGAGTNAWKFTDVTAQAGVREPIYSFPTWFFDFDNDGWLDLFVAGYSITNVGDICADYLGLPNGGEKARLYRNRGDGTFEDVTQRVHLDRVLQAMACNFGDLDNDGYLDFYLGTGDPNLATLIPNRMFRNAEGRFFQDVTTSGGFGHLQKGHAIAFADFNNDGQQDVFEVMGGAYPGDGYRRVLYENPGHTNHWLKLKLEGVQSNRSAIGARIKITILEQGRTRAIYKTVNSGGSFGANPLRQEIGLGQAERIIGTEILWPAGETQLVNNLERDSAYFIREGDQKPQKLHLARFDYAKATPAGQHHHHDQ